MVTPEIQQWLFNASMDDLNAVSSLISMRKTQIGIGNAMKFQPGDAVYFISRTRGRMEGKFVRLMRKNAEVKIGLQTWRVTPHMLRKVGDTASPPPEVSDEEG
jgi:hypothetical protein